MILLLLGLIGTRFAADPATEAEHAVNPVYVAVRADGLSVSGTSARLPEPMLHDGMTADAQRAALRTLTGSDADLNELTRNSVTAPFEVKNRSVAYPEGTIRLVDLWFVVYADLAEIDAKALSHQTGKGGATEAGNMRFEARTVTAEELSTRKIEIKSDLEFYVHANARLLDRIGVEATGRSVATHSAESWVIASQTAYVFDRDPELRNRWWPITRRGSREDPGESKPYAGWASYSKVSALKFKPGALLVEGHMAFAEPKAWFDGAPILRSKISLIAQDQIRHLRRELAKRRTEKTK